MFMCSEQGTGAGGGGGRGGLGVYKHLTQVRLCTQGLRSVAFGRGALPLSRLMLMMLEFVAQKRGISGPKLTYIGNCKRL